MALKKTVLVESGLMVPDTYIKVMSVSASKDSAVALIAIYATKEFANSGKAPIENQRYSFVPSVADGSANFIAQAYSYLKTLPEFADAIDC